MSRLRSVVSLGLGVHVARIAVSPRYMFHLCQGVLPLCGRMLEASGRSLPTLRGSLSRLHRRVSQDGGLTDSRVRRGTDLGSAILTSHQLGARVRNLHSTLTELTPRRQRSA